MSDYDVIVIGAGCGGLSAGALLAKQGRRVLVLEGSEHIGGCCSTFEKDGYSFDVGASIVEIVEPIDRTFAALGADFREEVDLIACDPIVTAHLRDGDRITYPASFDGTAQALEHFSRQDAANWNAYVKYFYELTDVIYDTLFSEPAQGFGDLVQMVRKHPKLLKYLPGYLTSYQAMLAKYFGKKTQESYAFQSFYFGLPPDRLPGVYALVPCTEHRGLYYVRGGMIQIPNALRRVGERYGLQVKLETPVAKVSVRDGRARGVRLPDGTDITADVVVSNVNAKTLYQRLIGEEHLPWLARRGVRSYEYSLACPMVYLGIDYRPPLDAHHTLISPRVAEINAYWRDRASRPIPHEQFGLIGWSTFSDPTLAPANKHVLNITMMGAYRGVDWDLEKKRFVDDVVDYLSKGVVPGLAEHVQTAECSTPLDFERRIGLGEGAIYGLAQDLPHGTVFRPSNKSKSIEGLYLVGSSTNPGGGVPTVIASGWITSNLIDRYES